MIPSPSINLSVHFSQNNVHTAKNDHRVSDRLAEAHVFQNGQVYKAGRTHTITIWIGRTVADEIKTEFAFRAFDAPVSFTSLWPKTANLRFGVHDRPFRNIAQGLVQNLQRLAHLQNADHVTVEHVAVLAKRNAKIKPVVDAVLIHLADIVIDAAGAQHRPGDAGVDGKFGRKHAHSLRTRDEDFVPG